MYCLRFLKGIVGSQTEALFFVPDAHLEATTDQLLDAGAARGVVFELAQISGVFCMGCEPQVLDPVVSLVVVDVIKTRFRPCTVHHSPDYPVDGVLFATVFDVAVVLVGGFACFKLYTCRLPGGGADQKAALVVVGEHAAEVDGGWFNIHVGILAWIRGISIPPSLFAGLVICEWVQLAGGVDLPVHVVGVPPARSCTQAHAHAHASCATRAHMRIMREAT